MSSPPVDTGPLPRSGDYHTWPDYLSTWRTIGRCEQPGPTPDGVYWNPPAGHSGGPTSTYPGGLGIAAGSWADYHTSAGVAQTNGALATPAEAIPPPGHVLAAAAEHICPDCLADLTIRYRPDTTWALPIAHDPSCPTARGVIG